jgi:predicted nucleic acid-binding Zn ribbon protein|tara:strand:+ start:495 stop:770 length:276 start_codon:yes stop_codon:yes gene_type:complete
MIKLKTALESTLKETDSQEIVIQGKAITLWPKAAGKEISKVTEATDLRKGVMFIKTENSSWRNELMFQKEEIIKKINTLLNNNIIKDIKFI